VFDRQQLEGRKFRSLSESFCEQFRRIEISWRRKQSGVARGGREQEWSV